MTKKSMTLLLSERKTSLADKYERLIKAGTSKPRTLSYQRLAAKYRRQAADLARTADRL